MPDSASIVKASTQDAKAMAKAKIEEGTPAGATKSGGEAVTSSVPMLSRQIQSTRVLSGEGGADGDEKASVTSVKPTAAKARAAPKNENTADETNQQSVRECLQRGATKEIEQSVKPREGKPAAKKVKDTPQTSKSSVTAAEVANKPEDPKDPEDDSSSSEDSEDLRQKEEAARKKREAHARYMRFSRSLTSFSTTFIRQQQISNQGSHTEICHICYPDPHLCTHACMHARL